MMPFDETCRLAARVARESQRRLSLSSLWPLTHCHSIACAAASRSNSIHKSLLRTSPLPFISLFFQPLLFQLGSHSVMPRCTYWESVRRMTAHGSRRACNPWITARSSMRLLVVFFSHPKISPVCFPKRSTQAQPPGPGLPMHAPSVETLTCFLGFTLLILAEASLC